MSSSCSVRLIVSLSLVLFTFHVGVGWWGGAGSSNEYCLDYIMVVAILVMTFLGLYGKCCMIDKVICEKIFWFELFFVYLLGFFQYSFVL